ncbi:MAG: hypothetical protein R3F51_13275 [Cyanobacteriota/Melainabacteria group bacterium]
MPRLAGVSVPLALFASAFTTSKTKTASCRAYSLLLFSGLWLNNQVWAEAGHTVTQSGRVHMANTKK